MQLDMQGKRLLGSGGTPIWDLETGYVLGILYGVVDSRTGLMAPTKAIAAAWPDLEVGLDVPAWTKRPRIFICHANEDSNKAGEIYERLTASGYDPWLDKRSLIVGQKWDYEIRKAVKESDFFVALLSEDSVSKKGYIQREFKLAMESLKEIPEGQIWLIPIKLDDCVVPTQFEEYQWVDLKGADSYEQIRKAIQFQLNSRKPTV